MIEPGTEPRVDRGSQQGSVGEAQGDGGRITAEDVPADVRRAVRRRCNFGCVVCGFPFYEYEHMLGWAFARRVVADEITLLCDAHRRERDAGGLSVAALVAANRAPHNVASGADEPYDLRYEGTACTVAVGSNVFACPAIGDGSEVVPVAIDGRPLLRFRFEDGHVLLSLLAFDDWNEPALILEENRLRYAAGGWDVRLAGRQLEILDGAGERLLDVTFGEADRPDTIAVGGGRFRLNGADVVVSPDHVLLANDGERLSGLSATDKALGLVIGPHPDEAAGAFLVPRARRYAPPPAQATPARGAPRGSRRAATGGASA